MDFRGRMSFLSNFWPVLVKMEGDYYPTVEHAYQAAKTIDPLERDKIRCAYGAGEAKKMGRLVKMRPGWNEMRIPLMADLLKQKFQNPDLRRRLLEVQEDPIVEGNYWHDNFWGACQCQACQGNAVPPGNILGMLLTEIRKGIKEGRL
jgi:ribA/ribD-fused uncharacterized protein